MLRNLLITSLFVFCASPAYAQVIWDWDASTNSLHGARNVQIDKYLYDVVFVEGACVDLFSGCDEVEDFDFVDNDEARKAAVALMDQVFVDDSGAPAPFDSDPFLTYGCEGNLHFQDCVIGIPTYEGFQPSPPREYLGYPGPRNTPFEDHIDGLKIDGANSYITGHEYVDTTSNEHIVFSDWTRVSIVPAFCNIEMSKEAYVDGDVVSATEIRFANQGPIALELKIWLGLPPDASPLSIINIGADGSFVLPTVSDFDLGPLQLFTVGATFPRGSYEFSCRMLDPVTGSLLAENRNVFEVVEKFYAPGDTGPAGGIVFYTTHGGAHGLEAPTENLANAAWGCSGTSITQADGYNIGEGRQNTAAIVAGCAESGIAAELVDTYSLNGYSDWFLPSTRELSKLFLARFQLGLNFPAGHYWSSSEGSNNQAYGREVTNLSFENLGKNEFHNVRPIRAF